MSNNAAGDAQPLGGTAIKPVGWDRTGFEAFRYMVYDPSTGKVFTRTPMSWLKIFVFYCVYYSLLAAFWLACLQVFFLTIPEDKPRWTLEKSLIGVNPGVGIKPVMDDKHIDSSMFYLTANDDDTVPTNAEGEGTKNIDYAKRADLFLAKYGNTSGLSPCADNSDPNKGRCVFDASTVLGECGEYPYGFIPNADGKLKPCVFIKLNKIYGFDPTPVDAANLDSYADMRQEMKDVITKEADKEAVFFDCFGRFPADKEAVKLKFFPESQSISLKYFPYTGGNYHSPVVAVQMEATQGQLVHMECRAWYDNVIHDKKDKAGLVQFEVMVN